MADYQGTARSNYFRVQDLAGLSASVSRFSMHVQPHPERPDYAMLFPTTDDGGWVTWTMNDEDYGEDLEFDPAEHICPYMAHGEVVILLEAGAEKTRYISGYARAFTWDGRHVELALSDIYKRVVTELGVAEGTFADAAYDYLPEVVRRSADQAEK